MLDLAQGSIANVGKYDLKFEGGKLVISANAGISAVEADVSIKVDAGALLDALAAAIPGQVDDAIIGVIKAALLSK